DKKKLVPTPKGIQIISLAEPEIKSPELTGNWEKRLSEISRGKDSASAFMNDIAGFVAAVVGKIKNSRSVVAVSSQPKPQEKKAPPPAPVNRPTFGVCPVCGKGQIIEGTRGFGCNRFREGCHYVVWKEFHGKKLPQGAIDLLIAGKTTRIIKGFVLEDGSSVAAKIGVDRETGQIQLIMEE
ncbi:MAG: DNA topoisomerase, partial [Candidatus Riflebacteria bacterium]